MRGLSVLLILLALGSCAAPPAPRPLPVPVPVVVAPPPPVPSPYVGDWRDWPVAPGDWVYRQDERGSIALFGVPGQDADFSIRCDKQNGRIFLSRRGVEPSAVTMTIRTSSLMRALASGQAGGANYMAASLNPSDALLDAMGYSRGRFVVQQAPLPTLVVPAWAELLRVTEDCRG